MEVVMTQSFPTTQILCASLQNRRSCLNIREYKFKLNTLPKGLEKNPFITTEQEVNAFGVWRQAAYYIPMVSLICENVNMHIGNREENKYLSIKIIIKLFCFQKVEESQNQSVCGQLLHTSTLTKCYTMMVIEVFLLSSTTEPALHCQLRCKSVNLQ